MMTTTYYAAHDSVSVYAIGLTPEDAINTAREDAQAPEAQFQTARVSTELARWIEAHGWDAMRESFTVCDGVLTRTTRED
jgi:hypothetical protein